MGMLKKPDISALIEGAYDLHVHSGPDLLPRKIDDFDMAKRVLESKMAGFVSKSHFFCTAQRAEMTRQLFPDCNTIGSICLNNAVGGINPVAVEMAARAGARLVWFPTCDAQWERLYAEKENGKKAFWAPFVEDLQKDHIEMPGISLMDENGKLKKCVHEVLEIIKKHQLVLCTGHISHEEAFALVKAAHDMKVEKIIITHVTFPSTFYTVEEQKELVRYGATMEQCYSTYATGKVQLEVMLQQIRELGPEHVVLGTDLGQPIRVYPEEGMRQFLTDLYEGGFSEREIKCMAHDHSEALIQP